LTKPLKTGGEVDAWCTRCRMLLNHRIVAMVGPKPVRVECLTCGSQHNFRPGAPGTKPERAETGASARRVVGASSGAPRGAAAALAKAEAERRERESSWEKAIAGKGMADFRRYDVGQTFKEGDLVRHSKFGDGVVVRVLDAKKIEVLFKDGDARTLAQGMT
jgi:hypothetical protein